VITRKVGPALAAGGAVVINPPSETPHSSLALTKLAIEVGIPAKCLQIYPTKDRQAAMELVKIPLVKKVSFTGSTPSEEALESCCYYNDEDEPRAWWQRPFHRLRQRRPHSRS
jgi:acyl-CoA reductase-like NAD-dependent aldehyde dehydrogenase